MLRKSVLDAATRLFAEKGYGGTNLQDIAATLGMSRPGLYYYFSSKEKLFEALLEGVTFALERQSSDIADREEMEPENALRDVISTHAAWLLAHGAQFRVVDRCENELPIGLRERHREAKRTILHNVTRIVERGILRGRFRQVDAQVAAFAMIGMCSWTAWWFNSDGRRTIAEVAEAIGCMAANSVRRQDVHRHSLGTPADAIRILKDDLAHLERLVG